MKQKKQLSAHNTYHQITDRPDCLRGAPRGRPNVGRKENAAGKRIYCRQVPLNKGGYDKGGAYWGVGAPLYVEYTLDSEYVRFFRK